MLTPELLEQVLSQPASFPLTCTVKQSAVLLLISNTDTQLTFLTKRSMSLLSHPGQISLPGGRIDPGDESYQATALREAQEETGLDPAAVITLGQLPTVQVYSSGVDIIPIVGWTNSRPVLTPFPDEVETIIPCPISTLLNPANYRQEYLIRDGNRRDYWVIDVGTHKVWGATAAILRSLSMALQAR